MISSEEINKQGVSIIIGGRNEFPQIVMTITSLMEDMLSTGITNYEFILQDNGSEDETSRFFAWKVSDKSPWKAYEYNPRGLIHEGRLKIYFDPVLSNVGTRNKGATHARFDNLIFADAHIVTRPGTVKNTLDALNEFGGLIHTPVAWMGADGQVPDPGYQYSYKVGEKIWGTWNRICIAPDRPFYIPITGHCWLGVKRDEFLEKRGYPLAQRVYGGGEPYLDTKWWMTGSTSMCDPRGLVYHLSAGRSYSWHNADLIHNMFLVSYILGGVRWADRILITYLNKLGNHPELLKLLYQEALAEGEADKTWLDSHKIMTFEELLRLDWVNDCSTCTKRGRPEPHPMRPWDRKNQELHGAHHSYVQEFKLEKRDGKVYIGQTEIVTPEALALAEKYL